MAKSTKDELTLLTQDWGGDGKPDAEGRQNPYSQTSDNLPFSGLQIQKFIKKKLEETGVKFGYIPPLTKSAEDGFFHAKVFGSKSEYDLYMEDPVAHTSLLLQDIQIPISTDKGTSYAARLYCDRQSTQPIVAITKDFTIGLRYCGTQTADGVTDNVGINGNIVIQRSTDGGSSWELVGNMTLTSRDMTSTEYDQFNIGQYFATTNPQQIRVRVSYNVLDDEGNIVATAQSAYMTFSNIIYTELDLEFASNYEQQVDGEVDNNRFPLEYHLKGEIERTLHVKISGGTTDYETSFNIDASEFTNYLSTWQNYAVDAGGSYGITRHGIRTIEAWLTCSDGNGGTISSKHIKNERMVYNASTQGADLTTPRLLLQNVMSEVTNYVSCQLMSYAIWHPVPGTKVPLSLVLGDYNNTVEYMRLEEEVTAGTKMPVNTTIEIEDSVNDTLYAYLRAYSEGKSMITNAAGYIAITVDNRDKFAPTNGADFVLNPKTRSNNEANPFRIINAVNGREVESKFDNFGADSDLWVEDSNGNRVLRVPAGRKLSIKYDWLKPFYVANNANVTLEIDIRTSNVTNEDDPIISMFEETSQNYIGLKLKPMNGQVFSFHNVTERSQNFGFQEDERTHIVVNIVSNLRMTSSSTETLNLCRVYINGIINREFTFAQASGEWWKNGSDIVIGQNAADIDIYSMRVYTKQLSSSDILRDYISTLPTSEEKLYFRKENAILGGDSLVNVDLCKQNSKNVLIWHGVQPNHEDTAKKKGWWEIHIYNEDGTEDLEHSGTICKQTGSLVCSRQGSTANTYYYSNMQTKLKDVEETITLHRSKIHPSIQEDYEYDASGNTEVVDGWIDGNGLYRGNSWVAADGIPAAQKLVNKINYASSMQSHLLGACRLYNDLHTAICGKNTMQQEKSKSRVCKYQIPFLYFNQETDQSPVLFQGPGTFGGGKMDDKTWGFDKKKHTMFAMIEGADNNLPLTDFRVPWDSSRITCEVEGDDTEGYEVAGYMYNGSTSLDVDKVVTVKRTIKAELGSSIVEMAAKAPSLEVEAKIKEFVNFIYFHNPRLRVFVGTREEFEASDADPNYSYWCTSGTEAFRLLRWQPYRKGESAIASGTWVDAGWNEDAETTRVRDLHTEFKDAYQNNLGNWDAMNSAFIAAIAAHAKANIGSIIKDTSLKFHYAFVNVFIAGTDNCSKNTYYVLDPTTLLWEFHQDDMDTIFATDNSGYQTKPYYIDRMNPFAEGSTSTLYEGGGNALFNLCEAMYWECGDIREMMKSIFTRMSSLVSASDNIPVEGSRKSTIWGCLHKYFFFVQKYIPAVCYNETARIRYEYPESISFVSDRNVRPIGQSMGDQLQAEMQYMKRRIILYASYAEWGAEFSVAASGSTGIGDVSANLGFQGTKTIGGAPGVIQFIGLTPHQYIYPTGRIGQSTQRLGQRCKPNVPVDFVLGQVDGDTACALYASNYYRSFGNIGDLSVDPASDFTINAKRLVDVTIVPSDAPEFRPTSIILNTPLAESVNMQGSNRIGGTIDASNMPRLKSLNLVGCDKIVGVTFPSSRLLESVSLGTGMESVTLNAQPNLQSVSLEGYGSLNIVSVDCAKVGFDVLSFTQRLYDEDPSKLSSVNIENINWTSADNVPQPMMVYWLCKKGANLTGKIDSSRASGTFTFLQKMDLANAYGDIDSESNDLYLMYRQIQITSIAIQGKKYIDQSLCTPNEDGTYTYKGLSLYTLPSTVNSVALKEGKPDVKWTLSSNAYAYVADSVTGELRINSFSEQDIKFTMSVEMKRMDGTTLTAEYVIGFYKRIPKLGDFCYLDGTFDDVYDTTKDLAGIVYARLWYEQNPDLVTKNNPILTYESIGGEYKLDSRARFMKLFIVSKEYMSQKTSDGLATPITTDMKWGLYPDASSGAGGFSTAEMQDVLNLINERLGTSYTSMFDLAELQNLKSSGLSSRAYADIIQSKMDDEEDYKYGGFEAAYTPKNISTTACGDWNGKSNTDKIVAWADAIIHTWISERYQGMDAPRTLQELADYMYDVLYKRVGDGTKEKYYQFAYPAAYACHLYQPSNTKGEVDEQLARGNWYLPACGELTRLYHHYNISRKSPITTTNTASNNNTPNAAYSEYDKEQGHEGVDAWNPIFAKAYQRITDAGASTSVLANINASYHWSSSEVNSTVAWYVYFYNSYVGNDGKCYGSSVRPVVAYTFEL